MSEAASAANAEVLPHFFAKWQAREPEMAIAEVFVPAIEKQRFRAWGALLHELRETLFELSDARVSDVKTAWWAEELIGIEQGRARHPLSALLAELRAPWTALGRSLLEPASVGLRASSTEEAVRALLPLAQAVIAVEEAIFPGATDSAVATRALVVHWLLQRLPAGLAAEDQARIPMHLYARHGLTAAQVGEGRGEVLLRDWAGELTSTLPEVAGAAPLRRFRAAFDRARLARLAAGQGFAMPSPIGTLWRAWRAARRV
ncbi:phytoene/squalene synthase family protein [Arenimonas sp.]|uniref:phytoene/squalene synthase family protein n=1 Tax=Arenimonas sp. TaxID=1872635 RepID=UPI0039E2BFFA